MHGLTVDTMRRWLDQPAHVSRRAVALLAVAVVVLAAVAVVQTLRLDNIISYYY